MPHSQHFLGSIQIGDTWNMAIDPPMYRSYSFYAKYPAGGFQRFYFADQKSVSMHRKKSRPDLPPAFNWTPTLRS